MLINKHFYFLGSLLFAAFINLTFITAFFIGPSSKFWMRGASPWDFYLPCIIATIVALGLSLRFDRQNSSTKDSIGIIVLKTYSIFCIGSIVLNFLIHAFLALKLGGGLLKALENFVFGLDDLGIWLGLGIPFCGALGWAYSTLSSALFKALEKNTSSYS